jgi:hypothetical protein
MKIIARVHGERSARELTTGEGAWRFGLRSGISLALVDNRQFREQVAIVEASEAILDRDWKRQLKPMCCRLSPRSKRKTQSPFWNTSQVTAEILKRRHR